MSITMGGVPSNSNRPSRPVQTIRIIGKNIGQVSVTFELNFNSKHKSYQDHLIDIQAKLNQSLSIYHDVTLTPDSYSNHQYYKGICSSGCGVRVYTVFKWSKRRKRCLLLELYGSFFENHDYNDALQIIDNINKIFNLAGPVICRFDYFIDLIGFYPTWGNLKSFFTLLRPIQIIPSTPNHPISGVTWGKRGQNQVNFYNKTKELSQQGKTIANLYPNLKPTTDVWRFEGRWWRPWLRKRKWSLPSLVLPRASDILGYAMTHTLYVRGRNGKRAKHWMDAVKTFGTNIPPPQPSSTMPFNKLIAAKTLCAIGARYAVGVGLTDPTDSFAHALSVYQGSGFKWNQLLAEKKKAMMGGDHES